MKHPIRRASLLIIVLYVILRIAIGNRIEIIRESPGDRGLVVVQVSDLHFTDGIRRVHRRAARAIENVDPDILVITGDSTGFDSGLDVLGEWLDGLEAARGRRYAILGNWEYQLFDAKNRFETFYSEHDVELLVNRIVDVPRPGGSLRIIGLDDYLYGTPDYTLVESPGSDSEVLILIHEPDAANVLAGRAKDAVILSGHTHGGQITLLGRALYTPPGSGRFIAGSYEIGGNRLIVSKGVGASTVEIRIGPRPDIVVLDYPE